nr:AAA family ATPase [Hyphomonas sp. Mor2]
MSSNRFYILAGPPGAGKTTLLSQVSSQIATVPEYARRVLAHERQTGGRATGDQDQALFVERMLELALNDYRRAEGVTLFDRGLPDLLAFCAHYGLPDDHVRDAVSAHRYHPTVFFLPPWEDIYATDDERLLDFVGAAAFGNLIQSAYEQSGYDLIDVPKTPPHERAKFILERMTL